MDAARTAPSPSKWPRILRVAGVGLCLVPIGVWQWGGETTYFSEVALWVPVRLWLLGAFLAMLIAARIERSNRRLFALLVPLVAAAWLHVEWPSDNHPLPGSVPLKLMTFNMNWGNVRGPEAVAQAVLDDSPDVVCLQEVSPHPPPHLDPVALKHALPGFAFHWFGEMMIASRYPIVARRQFPLPGNLDSRPVLEVDLDVRGRRVRVLDVHLVATHIFGFGPSGIGRMLDVRQAQLKTIEARIDASPYPLVLAGDFNFTPFHAAYRRLGRHLQEAGEGQRGRWDATIPAVFPMRRLDLIFVSKGIDVLAANALDVNASDHEPYRAALSIQDSKVKLTRSD